ncbi:beta-xylosidase/alpha-l-arabinosidase [Microbispora bryophytorum]|uniref:Exo-alpha-(1->6)-L-arabinopyranosidase n=1 Tax=Microbispora bryophytorum TaxID=1460882 RepID=A0A8H9GUU7_9ACTN|nr:glycoside hydrolase family 3 N-terminal domain-containing protein [Microbispora bryophytorum]MBD3138720.1 glycoside hydrolase family 3 C-terminal domain-containing protein [Microbispora bryophytorum]TQS03738.1 glycosyl hydrolase [Microbispora bryophytorum]GGO02291.1 glycosyl hydrolase [Microbispora bryophytorum]
MTAPDRTHAADGTLRAWQDPALPVADRVEALLAEMTLEEKVGQLGSRWLGNDMQAPEEAEPENALNVAPMQDVFAASGTVPIEEAVRDGLGHLTRVFGSAPVTAVEGAADVVRLQREVVKQSRLGIPALVHEECLTGFTTYGATVYPAAIAWGATFDPELVERMAAAIGRDMRAVGAHQGLSPVLDVVRDYRWGRVEETLGEDPYLVAMLGAAYVRGLEKAGVIATLKHFAGYSASRAARNHGPVPMGRRELMDMILPTFETAIAEGGARSVMNSYSDVDGVPAAADPWLLTEVLRDEWGFTGTVVSDYWAIAFLAKMHQVAADHEEAGVLALTAGIDVELPDTLGFGRHLVERVRRGELPEDLVDRAARRLLTQKVQLGLLDPDWTPEGSVAGADTVDLDSPDNRALARELAERSIVLLDAGDALPLLGEGRPGPRRVAVVGPCADDPRTFMGCYAFPNHVLPRHPNLGLGVEAPSLLDALRAELPDAEIVHERGCDWRDEDRSGFAAALAAARESDLCVAVVGDLAGLFGQGTSGEGCDAEDLRLPGTQEDLLVELAATGTPVVVVVVSGRPYALGRVREGAAAIVQAFMPGEEGGAAIAGVLSGRVQPSGKLPVQIPRTPGGQPGTYLQPPLGSDSHGISNLDPTPLFPFGYGASYTAFEVGDLEISDSEVSTDGEFTVSVRVRNTGGRAGEEVVQLYLHDVLAQVTRPVRQLAGFARVRLEPGESARATFVVHADRTAFTGRDLRRIVEPGDVDVFVGTSASDLPCQGRVRLTGPLRHVGHDRRLVTPVEVRSAAGPDQGGTDAAQS